MNKEMLDKLGGEIAIGIGTILQQSYIVKDGKWWLTTLGKPVRELRQDEVDWHTVRNHQPFVKDGITPDHPDWFKDPVTKE